MIIPGSEQVDLSDEPMIVGESSDFVDSQLLIVGWYPSIYVSTSPV